MVIVTELGLSISEGFYGKFIFRSFSFFIVLTEMNVWINPSMF